MLKYIIIGLSDSSTSFCHYANSKEGCQEMKPETLSKIIKWAMMENLFVQILYPSYKVAEDLKKSADAIDHIDIVPADCQDTDLLERAKVVVFNGIDIVNSFQFKSGSCFVLRIGIEEAIANIGAIKRIIDESDRLNIVYTDLTDVSQSVFSSYAEFLTELGEYLTSKTKQGLSKQLNILTDRISLSSMNNCGAGEETLFVSPQGDFYICPAFYQNGDKAIGNIDTGINIPNQQLYSLEKAPICRICDAWQCKRCVWLNKMTTLEYNTPSHQQCVISHLERNVSKGILDSLKQSSGLFAGIKDIPEIDYLDPIEKIIK